MLRCAAFCFYAFALALTAFAHEERGRIVSTMEDFTDVSRWTSSRSEDRLNDENFYYRFSSIPEAGRSGNGLRWEFKIRNPKQRYNDLYGNFQIEEPFDRISVWVRNPAKKQIKFWLKLVEADGSDYRPEPLGVPIGGTADWQRVEFRWDQYQVANWSTDENNTLDLPLKNVVLVVYDVNPGEEYQLDFDDMELSRPGPEKIGLVKAEGPTTVRAGGDVAVRFTLAAVEPLRGDYAIFLSCMREGKLFKSWIVQPPSPTSKWKPGQPVELPAITMRIPQFAEGGKYEVRARLGWTKLAGKEGGETIMSFTVEPRQAGPIPRAEIRPHNGVPTLFINGKPNAAMTYMTYNRSETKYFRDFGAAGVDLATFSATSDFSFYGLAPPTWLAPDVFDYSNFDQRIVSILEANPNAHLFPRVYISAPTWWCKAHPDEVAQQADGTNVKGPHFHDTPFATPASEKWRQEAARALRKFIEHVRSSPYADRVIGYHIASLHTEEWFYHNFWANKPSYWGYAKPDLAAFRQWLQKKYGTVEALRRAWRDEKAEFTNAAVPSQGEREGTDLGFFRDPAKSQRVIDFYLYYNDIIADTIEYFARVVKEATNRESLYGVFYGYLFELSGSPEGGHLALERLLRSPDVDFFCAPSSYGFRPLGTGCSAFMSVTEAIKFHGKLWFNENDYRTHLMPQKKGVFDYVDLKTLPESIDVQKRELVHTLCLGTGMWWFDMGGGWYDHLDFMKAIAEMNRVGEKSIAFDRSSAAEIAVVVDEASMCFREARGRFANLLLNQQRNQLHRIGAPVDFVFLNDLEKLRPYKVYVFLSTFKVDAGQRAIIDKVVKKDGKAAVWVYAPGFVGDTLSDEGVSSLTGIKITHENEPDALKMKITNTSDDITKGAPQTAGWGGDVKVSPVFFCVDDSAKALGILEGINKTGLAVKRFPHWTSVYCAGPNLPSWLLRGIAKSAGVHVFNNADDVLYASKSFLGIHSNEAGPRTLHFAQPTSLYEIFDRQQVATNATEVKVDLPARHTAFYFQGTAEEWEKSP